MATSKNPEKLALEADFAKVAPEAEVAPEPEVAPKPEVAPEPEVTETFDGVVIGTQFVDGIEVETINGYAGIDPDVAARKRPAGSSHTPYWPSGE